MRMLCVIVAFFFCAGCIDAGENKYLTSGVSRARALAMGSAYHSVVDDFSAGLYNPGAFQFDTSQSGRRFRVFFNPVGMTVALYDFSKYDLDFVEDDKLTGEEGLRSSALLFKGAVLTTSLFEAGINLGEEIIGETPLKNRKHFFSIEGETRNSFDTAFMNFKISQTVSIGVSGALYSSRNEGRTSQKGGYTVGVLLNPNPKLNLGIAYNDIPDMLSPPRLTLESIEGETVTSGISYYPDRNTIVSIDLRNLNKEDKHANREIHTGFERIVRDRIALRAGYYRKKLTNNDVYSIGIGILPSRSKISTYINSSGSDILSYSLLSEENGHKCRWHVFSLLLRY